MRTEADLIRVDIRLLGNIELDLERLELDPTWRSITSTMSLPKDMPIAVQEYLRYYILRERLLREMPSTTGPGTLILESVEVT